MLLFFISCIVNGKTYFQELDSDSVPVYRIVNHDFYAVLDSFIMHEKQYDYYNTHVTFFVNVLDSAGVVFELNSGAMYEETPIIFSFRKKNAGAFTFKEHTFILTGRSIISNQIMAKTCGYQNVKFVDIDEFDDDAIEYYSYFPTSWICRLDKDSILILSKVPLKKIP